MTKSIKKEICDFLREVEKNITPEMEKQIDSFSESIEQWRTKYDGSDNVEEMEDERTQIYEANKEIIGLIAEAFFRNTAFWEDGGDVQAIDEEIERLGRKRKELDAEQIGKVALLTGKFLNALKPTEHEQGYIVKYTPDDYEIVFDEEGNPRLFASESATARTPEYDETLFNILLNATIEALKTGKHQNGLIRIPFNEFCKEMKIRPNEATRKDGKREGKNLIEKLSQLNEIMVFIPGLKEPQRAFLINNPGLSNNAADTAQLSFYAPAIFALAQNLLNSPREKLNGKNAVVYSLVEYDDKLIKPEIYKASNKKTASLIMTFAAGLRSRGTKPDAQMKKGVKFEDERKVTYPVTFKYLIDNSKETTGKDFQTVQIQRMFCGNGKAWKGDPVKATATPKKGVEEPIFIEYIRKYTRLFDYFIDLEITFKAPTAATLKNKIIATHHGLRGEISGDKE